MRISHLSPVQFPNQIARSQRTNLSSLAFSTTAAALNPLSLGSKGGPVRQIAGSPSVFADPIPSRPTPSHNSAAPVNTLAPSPETKVPDQPKAADGPALTGNISLDAIALVSANLRKRGFDPANFGFSYSEDPVSYPGGSYLNRQITAHVNGHVEQYDAGLVMKNPEVAAVEILRLMGQPA